MKSCRRINDHWSMFYTVSMLHHAYVNVVHYCVCSTSSACNVIITKEFLHYSITGSGQISEAHSCADVRSTDGHSVIPID